MTPSYTQLRGVVDRSSKEFKADQEQVRCALADLQQAIKTAAGRAGKRKALMMESSDEEEVCSCLACTQSH